MTWQEPKWVLFQSGSLTHLLMEVRRGPCLPNTLACCCWTSWPSSTMQSSLKMIFSELLFWLYTAQRPHGTNFCSHNLLLTHEIIHVCPNEYFNPKKAKGAYEFTWLKHIRRGLIDGINSGATHANGNIIIIILLNICLFTRRFCLIKRMSYVYWLWEGLKPKKLIHLHVMIFWQ